MGIITVVNPQRSSECERCKIAISCWLLLLQILFRHSKCCFIGVDSCKENSWRKERSAHYLYELCHRNNTTIEKSASLQADVAVETCPSANMKLITFEVTCSAADNIIAGLMNLPRCDNNRSKTTTLLVKAFLWIRFFHFHYILCWKNGDIIHEFINRIQRHSL